MANSKASGGWVKRLLTEDFSARCKEDRICLPCAAAFCSHCCRKHHRGQGHGVLDHTGGAHALLRGAFAVPCPASIIIIRSRDKDSFCVTCGAGFSAAICAHHGGHDTFHVVVFEGRHCAQVTGSEPWFHVFDGIETYHDENGHILVPLHPRNRAVAGGGVPPAAAADEAPGQ